MSVAPCRANSHHEMSAFKLDFSCVSGPNLDMFHQLGTQLLAKKDCINRTMDTLPILNFSKCNATQVSNAVDVLQQGQTIITVVNPLMNGESANYPMHQIVAISNKLLCILKNLGVTKGDRVLVRCDNNEFFIASFLAVIKMGAIAVVTNPFFGTIMLQEIVNDCSPKVLLVDADTFNGTTRVFLLNTNQQRGYYQLG